jgi:tetratricopeptide (TPR) repeat protein
MIGQWGEMFHHAQTGLECARFMDDLKCIVFIETEFLAWSLNHQGRCQEAETYIIEALRITRQMNDIAWQCEVLSVYSQILHNQNKSEQAIEYCQQALELVKFLPGTERIYQQADIEYEIGRIACEHRDWQLARQYFLSVQNVFRPDHDNPIFNIEFAWIVTASLGFVEYHLGNIEAATQMYQQALAPLRELSKSHMTTLLVRFALLEEQRGNRAKALTHAHEALEWSKRLGMVKERVQAEAIITRLEGESS